MLYARTILTRSGLSNRLFPWARCTVFSCACGVPMLAPRWMQFKIGPFLRRERDLRLYHGLFRSLDSEVRGFEREWIVARWPRLAEPEDLTSRASFPDQGVVTFEGLGDFFARLGEWRDLLASRLLAAARPAIVMEVARMRVPAIGIHVRRGDFRASTDSPERGAMQTPVGWFLDVLRAVRQRAGGVVEAFVVSDGHDDELTPFRREPSVRVLRSGNALGDLLLLTRAKVVLGSMGSSFSAWASFLGGSPVATMPGPSYAEVFQFHRALGPFADSWDPNNPDPRFLKDAANAIAKAG